MNKTVLIIGGVLIFGIVIFVTMRKINAKAAGMAGKTPIPTTPAPATGPESQAFISAGGAGSSAYGSAATA